MDEWVSAVYYARRRFIYLLVDWLT